MTEHYKQGSYSLSFNIRKVIRCDYTKKRNMYTISWDGKKYDGNIKEISKQSGEPIERLWLAVTAPTLNRYGERYGTQYPIYEIYKVKSGEYTGTGTVEDVSKK